MITAFWSGLSALRAFGKKMDAISNNVANHQSEGYRAKRAVLEAEKEGGVRARIEPENKNIQQQGNGNSAGEASRSDVDLTKEMPRTILTKRGFEANIKTITTEDEILGTIIDIFE